jgi:hypothetical protein
VAFGVAELSREKSFDKVPGHHGPHDPAAKTDNVHVIVLDALPSREVIIDQSGVNSRNFVGANGSTDSTPANSNPALNRARHHCPRQRNDEIRVVVAWFETIRTKVNNLMTRGLEAATKILFQSKSAVIGGDSNAHMFSSSIWSQNDAA